MLTLSGCLLHSRKWALVGMFSSLSKDVTTLALDSSEVALLLFGLLLVVGLVGEYAESERWKKYVKAFEMLVILGVAGELLADAGVFTFSARLQSLSDVEVARLKVAAESANATAKQFESQIAEANSKADSARTNAESFRLDIAKANERAAKAEVRAAEANLELTKLKTPRTLNPRQQERAAEKLRAFARMQFDTALLTDPETQALLPKIEDILTSAGWIQIDWTGSDIVFTRSNRHIAGTISVSGVVIQIHAEKVAQFATAANALALALSAEGIAAKAELGLGVPNTNPNAIHVLIGKKP
jgi:hypothetical protein